MSITEQEIYRMAQLASLELSSDQATRIQTELSGILTLIKQLQSANTQGVEPMVHPLCGQQTFSLRLRPDTPRPTATTQQRDKLMANAPASSDGLFLVPTVIE